MGAQGFISRGMLPVSKDTHLTHSLKTSRSPNEVLKTSMPLLCYFFIFTHSPKSFSLLFLPLLPFFHLHVPLNFLPPLSSPSFPVRHAHLCVSCMFGDSQTIHFFHGPGRTRMVKSYCGEWVWFFFFYRAALLQSVR